MLNLPRVATLIGYLLCVAWYAWDMWSVYDAINSGDDYPFFLDVGAAPATAFMLGGSLYWFTFGLDRSATPRAVIGYVMAGLHVLVFAFQVWLGPTLWAMKHLSE